MKEFLNESEAAKLVGSTERILQRARLAGKPVFPFVMIGAKPTYARTAILATFYSASNATPPQPQNNEIQALLVAAGQVRRSRGRPRKGTGILG